MHGLRSATRTGQKCEARPDCQVAVPAQRLYCHVLEQAKIREAFLGNFETRKSVYHTWCRQVQQWLVTCQLQERLRRCIQLNIASWHCLPALQIRYLPLSDGCTLPYTDYLSL